MAREKFEYYGPAIRFVRLAPQMPPTTAEGPDSMRVGTPVGRKMPEIDLGAPSEELPQVTVVDEVVPGAFHN